MSVHDDTLQGLQEALDYVKGDTAKGRSVVVEIPDDDIIVKFNKLSEESQQAIRIIIDNLLVANSKVI